MQSQDPSQGAYPRFEEPNPTAGFTVHHGNPYDQTNQAYVPPPQYGQPDQPNVPQGNSLLVQSGVQEIDQKLESGCWACYKCWTYVMLYLAWGTLITSVRQVFSQPIFIVNILDAIIELCFALMMQAVIKEKRLYDAQSVWCLALTCSGFFGFITFIQRSAYMQIFGVTGAYEFFAGYALYYALVYIFPAFQLKALLERREMILKSANPYQVQGENLV